MPLTEVDHLTIADLESTPMGQQILQARADAAFGERQRDVDALAELSGALRVAEEEAGRERKSYESRVQKASAALEKATDELRGLDRVHGRTIGTLKQKIRILENQLRDSADPRIEAARRGLSARWEEMRRTCAHVEQRQVPGQLYESGKAAYRSFSNYESCVAIVTALAPARIKLEALKTANPRDLDAAIAEIERTVPFDRVGELTEIRDGA